MEDKDIERKILDAIKSAPVPPTDFFVSRVMARLESPSESTWRLRWWRLAAVALGAAASFLIISQPVDDASLSTQNLLLTNSDICSESQDPGCEFDDLLGITSEDL